ncbi:MAG: hypothetical protein RMJ84_13305, partial [Sandaracinaceae bacterium]|nr:hypothetical protein [Sandaracinaceae bacterium]
KGIWVRRLPEVDDEFAKDVGDYESLEALRQAIKAQLEEEAKRRSDERLRNDAVEQFVQKNPIPLPPSLVEREMASSLANQRQIVKLLGASEKIVDENKENTRKQIEKEVRAAILFLELATRQGISVSEEEIDRALAELAVKQGKPLAKLKAEYSGEKRERFQQKLLYNKLIDFLISQARIVEKRIPEPIT